MRVTRTEVRRVLSDWEGGCVSASEVHSWAERRYAVEGSEAEDEVVNEVLSLLDALDVNLTAAADIPALRRLLDSMPHGLHEALTEYGAYVGTIDMLARKRELGDDPLYARFCSSSTHRDGQP